MGFSTIVQIYVKVNLEPNVDKWLPTYPSKLVTKHRNMNIRDINMFIRDIRELKINIYYLIMALVFSDKSLIMNMGLHIFRKVTYAMQTSWW